jgi:DNA-binding MarR family transcriptional regulator
VVRWLDGQEEKLWRGYLRMNTELHSRLNRHLVRETGLSAADYEVLVNLSEAPDGRRRAFELRDSMQWEQSRLSHHLTRMERRGLVEREECTTDGRGAVIAITAAGRTAIEDAAPDHVAEVRRLFIDVLTPAQRRALAAISATVIARLAADDG